MGSAALTREKLITTGRAAFAQKGHAAVSLQKDILEPSGVSTGSFYHQFTDKTDLLVAILNEASEKGQGLMAAAKPGNDSDDPATVLRRAYGTWFALIDNAEDIFRIQLRERENPDPRVRDLIAQVRDDWMNSLERDYEAIDTPVDFDPAMTARLIGALSTGAMIQYLDTPKRERPALQKKFVDHLVDFTLGGLRGLDLGL